MNTAQKLGMKTRHKDKVHKQTLTHTHTHTHTHTPLQTAVCVKERTPRLTSHPLSPPHPPLKPHHDMAAEVTAVTHTSLSHSRSLTTLMALGLKTSLRHTHTHTLPDLTLYLALSYLRLLMCHIRS